MGNDSQGSQQAGLTSLFTLDEAATVLNVSRSQILTWIQQDVLPIVRLGSGPQMIRIRQMDLMTFATKRFSSRLSDLNDDKGE